jgi:hypothetical protein
LITALRQSVFLFRRGAQSVSYRKESRHKKIIRRGTTTPPPPPHHVSSQLTFFGY